MKVIFSVYDMKSQMHGVPFSEINDATAVRAMMDVMKNKDHPFHNYPDDYELVRLAEFDERTGEITVEDRSVVISLNKLTGE